LKIIRLELSEYFWSPKAITIHSLRYYFVRDRFAFFLRFSIIIHLILGLILLLTRPEKAANNEINVSLLVTPDQFLMQTREMLSTEEASTTNDQKNLYQDQKSGERAEYTNTTEKEVTNTEESGFMKEFENMLFKKNTNVTENTKTIEEQLEWKEQEHQFHSDEKANIREKVVVPGGRASSNNIVWKDGYARKTLYTPEFEYPETFRKEGIEGIVKITIYVDSYGNVVKAEVLQSSGHSRLDISAKNGMLKTKFMPSKEAGSQKIDRAEIEVLFKLKR